MATKDNSWLSGRSIGERLNSGAAGGAIALILIGIVAAYFGPRFDGFVKGFLQGAGLALIVVGAAVAGAVLQRRRSEPGADGLWLPSEDGPVDGR